MNGAFDVFIIQRNNYKEWKTLLKFIDAFNLVLIWVQKSVRDIIICVFNHFNHLHTSAIRIKNNTF